MTDASGREASGPFWRIPPPPPWSEPQLSYYEMDYVRGLRDRIAELEAERDLHKVNSDAIGEWMDLAEKQQDRIAELEGRTPMSSDERVPYATWASARIAELEAEREAAWRAAFVADKRVEELDARIEELEPPWHLRDDDGKRWRVVPVYVDPDRTRELFALEPAEETDDPA